VNSLQVTSFLRLAFSVAFAVMASGAGADAAVPRTRLELTAANLASVVDPLMAEWIDKHQGPGAVVVVVTRDGPVFAKGYGFSDIDAKKPFTADATLVRPGSISKLFTGIAVMQLVDAAGSISTATSMLTSTSPFRRRKAAFPSRCAVC
jgi:CubicO group peptidase (beta-lactamase class C family)